MNVVATALGLAAAHPTAALPCPLCPSSVKGANVAAHVAKVHAGATGADAPLAWRGKGALGLIPATLSLDDAGLHLRGVIARRTARLPSELVMGALYTTRPDPLVPDDVNAPGTDVTVGTYLRVVGPRELVVACRAKAARLGAAHGPRSTRRHVTLAREAFVALQYALLERGLLALA